MPKSKGGSRSKKGLNLPSKNPRQESGKGRDNLPPRDGKTPPPTPKSK